MVEAGLSVWQVLPLNPPDRYHSPYNCSSVFALNPEFARHPAVPLSSAPPRTPERSAAGPWLEDYALFEMARSRLGSDWRFWPSGLKHRRAADLERLRADSKSLAEIIEQQQIAQAHVLAIRQAANDRGILLFGDMPLYPAYQSADVWACPGLFDLNEDLSMRFVAGVPPDYFSATGQLWGNPLYDWSAMAADGYAWWIQRLDRLMQLLDVVRIDHFRGLCAYWAVRPDAPDASSGHWREGPSHSFLHAITSALPEASLVAEDLGSIDEQVEALRDDFHLPGMRVLQFAFSGDPENPHLPEHYVENSVAYTGTHDNDTTIGWHAKLDAETRALVDLRLGGPDEPAWRMLELVCRSKANTAIMPAQDFIGLDASHRMNTPGTRDSNWRWRLKMPWLSSELATRIRKLTDETGRS